jgi:hypothetical protein
MCRRGGVGGGGYTRAALLGYWPSGGPGVCRAGAVLPSGAGSCATRPAKRQGSARMGLAGVGICPDRERIWLLAPPLALEREGQSPDCRLVEPSCPLPLRQALEDSVAFSRLLEASRFCGGEATRTTRALPPNT